MYMFGYYVFVLKVTLQTECVVHGGRLCTGFLNSDELCILARGTTSCTTAVLLLESNSQAQPISVWSQIHMHDGAQF